MKHEKLFTIGQISKISKVPQSTLRYYDEVGVLKPCYIHESTGYRYYDNEALQMVPVLRYYQVLGFQLKEIPDLLARDNLSFLENLFEEKMRSFDDEIERLRTRKESIASWADLIKETKEVMALEECNVGIKTVPQRKMFTLKPVTFPEMQFRNLLINNEFCAESYEGKFTSLGALYITFVSEESRFSNDFSNVELSICNHPRDDNHPNSHKVEGFTAITCYHKGSYDTMKETYARMKDWAKKHRFTLRGDCIERYVIDCWSTTNADWYLTEIYLPLAEKKP